MGPKILSSREQIESQLKNLYSSRLFVSARCVVGKMWQATRMSEELETTWGTKISPMVASLYLEEKDTTTPRADPFRFDPIRSETIGQTLLLSV